MNNSHSQSPSAEPISGTNTKNELHALVQYLITKWLIENIEYEYVAGPWGPIRFINSNGHHLIIMDEQEKFTELET